MKSEELATAASETLEHYILAHSDPEPDYLYQLWRATNIHMLHGRMASGHLQGRLLKMLVTMNLHHLKKSLLDQTLNSVQSFKLVFREDIGI